MISDLFADAGDDGIRFILQIPDDKEYKKGGLVRDRDQGHFVTIAGRGGTGKSVLALQFLTKLLNQSDKSSPVPNHDVLPPDTSTELSQSDRSKGSAAFYFTLEASPLELVWQLGHFAFGIESYSQKLESEDSESTYIHGIKLPKADDLSWSHAGLYIQAIPSPVEDLSVLIRQVRQTIADVLVKPSFSELVGIVIDPLGGVRSRDTLRTDLSALKHLADSHKTFLFLLAEDHIYEQHRSIEHYSQTVLQLEYDPSQQPSRRIVVQKARSQPFRAGYHQLDLRESGVTVFPSVEAQSAYAHDLRGAASAEAPLKANFLKEKSFDQLQSIDDGSAIFLMGPPGTFKQYIACDFATAPENASSLYISFKADLSAVKKYVESVEEYHTFKRSPNRSKPATCFIDARSPLSTPQEILTMVRTLMDSPRDPPIRRAVVWGLRRLADMPNFSGSTAVQFLEALVTLLQARRTTCLLVDWPDIEKGNALPIVDLSQYILLTRLCHSRSHLREDLTRSAEVLGRAGGKVHDIDELVEWYHEVAERVWKPIEDSPARGQLPPQHVALLRVQRDKNEGFHRDVGFRFVKSAEPRPGIERIPEQEFETSWNMVGDRWEKDPSLS